MDNFSETKVSAYKTKTRKGIWYVSTDDNILTDRQTDRQTA